MISSAEEDHLKKANKLEIEKLAKIRFTPAHVTDLDGLLSDFYISQCPRPIDYCNRRDLIRIFNVIAKEIYGDNGSSPVVEGYGSFVMDMFNDKSDLDLSINFNDSVEVPRQKKIETLHKFAKKLQAIQRKGHVIGVQPIMTARVPIVKVTDCGTGIECDLSVNNRDGIVKSHIIYAISAIDERFRKLSFLMKSWAKAHNINSSRDRTFNSLSIISLVAFHLQTCNPPILPPFSALLKEGVNPASVTKVISNYLNYGKQNSEPVAKLFVTLIVKLASVQKLWQKGFCASLYEGSWILKSWKHHSYSINIEDFTDRSQNVARAVGTEEVKEIYRCIHKSLNYLLLFLNGQMQGINLIHLLFGSHTVSTLGVGGPSRVNLYMNSPPTLQNPHSPKKRRLAENLVENQDHKPRKRNNFGQGWQGAEPQGMGGMQQALFGTLHNALASFTPSFSHQPPLAIPSTDVKVHHSYGQGTGPSAFALNPLGFNGSYNPSIQSHLVSSPNSVGFVGTFNQNAVASNPYHGSVHSHLPQVSHNLYGGDHTFYRQRSG